MSCRQLNIFLRYQFLIFKHDLLIVCRLILKLNYK
nr:MAG TPA: hypothetical protein [Caudoviricetes sp.]